MTLPRTRYPLAAKIEHWPAAARQLREERMAILLADGLDPKHAEAIVRRAWAMPGDMPPEW